MADKIPITLYPNPGIDQLAIKDAFGRVILLRHTVSGDLRSHPIDLSDIPSGIYFLTAETSMGLVNKKFMVVK